MPQKHQDWPKRTSIYAGHITQQRVTIINIHSLPGLSVFTAPIWTQIPHPNTSEIRESRYWSFLLRLIHCASRDNISEHHRQLPVEAEKQPSGRGVEGVEGSSIFHLINSSNFSIFSHLLSFEQWLSPRQTCWWEESMPRHTLAT